MVDKQLFGWCAGSIEDVSRIKIVLQRGLSARLKS